MNEENRDVKIDAGVAPSPASTGDADQTKRLRLWVNWALAALTVTAVVAVTERWRRSAVASAFLQKCGAESPA